MLKTILDFILGPPSPGGSRGRVRTAIFLKKSGVLGRFRPGSEGKPTFYSYFGPKRSWDVFKATLSRPSRLDVLLSLKACGGIVPAS